MVEVCQRKFAVYIIAAHELAQVRKPALLHGLDGFAVAAEERIAHQIMLYAPAQVNRQMAVGCQLVDGQFFLFYDLDVVFGRFHERVVVIYFVRVSDDVQPLRVDYLKRFVGTFFEKFVDAVFAFEIYLLFIKRDELIEIHLVAVREPTGVGILAEHAGREQQRAA